MKFAKTLQMTTNTLPDEYKDRVLNYKKFKKSINKIVTNLEDTGVYELPENENCKIVYSLKNDGDEKNIKSSLILFIDKDYVAELSSKDALELNSEELKIDPELTEVFKLTDDKEAIVTTKVTKEKILKSFQTAKNSKSDFIYNKTVPLNRLSRHNTTLGSTDKPTSMAEDSEERVPLENNEHKLGLKRSKSDGGIKVNYKDDLKMKCMEEPEEVETVNDVFETQSLSEGLNNIPMDKETVEPYPLFTLQKSDSHSSNSTVENDNENPIIDTLVASSSSANGNNDKIQTPLTPPTTPSNTPTTPVFNSNNEPINNTSDNIPTPDTSDCCVDGFIDCTNTAKENDERIVDVKLSEDYIEEHEDEKTVKSLKVLLETDAKFLNDLAAALSQLSAFQSQYKQIFETKINLMSNILADVSSPMMNDTYKWRELLKNYIESDIWTERGKDRTPEDTIHQLKLFETKIGKLNKHFKIKKSQQLLNEFIQLNYDIVAIKRFYELNQTAVYKILKKHDKRTHLLASEGFPKFTADETFFKDNIARSLVFQISSRLLTVIPNPDDYACPICKELSYKPIRLDCGHLYCLRCLVKAQKKNITNCPLCRATGVVAKANSLNLDKALMKKMRVEFPKEVKVKLNQNKAEKAQEDSESMLKLYGYSEKGGCAIM